ncbi:MAG: AraC family transcriptional regulator [Parvibaculaceae bacterium]
MDILDDILGTLNLKGVLYFRTDFSAPWSVTVPDHDMAARFHLVVEGRLCLTLPDGTVKELGPGDLALIPRGRAHVLADAPGRVAPPLETVLDEAGYDGKGVLVAGGGDRQASTQLVCGHFTFRPGADHPILRALPDALIMTASDRAREPWLDEMLRLIVQRVFSGEIGSVASVTRLSEIMFIDLLRVGVHQCPALRAVLGAFRDAHIGKALHLIHERAADTWTVETLASAVGMSRSRFAERFRDLTGMGPMAYLSDWRLQKALSLLEDSRCSVQEVAVQAGYQSPAAFSRAFSGKFGIAPTKYRRATA